MQDFFMKQDSDNKSRYCAALEHIFIIVSNLIYYSKQDSMTIIRALGIICDLYGDYLYYLSLS